MTRRRLAAALVALGEDPLRPRPRCDIRRLEGSARLWAVRVGVWRIVYAVDLEAMSVRVTDIAHRRSAYGR